MEMDEIELGYFSFLAYQLELDLSVLFFGCYEVFAMRAYE